MRDKDHPVPRHFQFGLRGLMIVVTIAAVIAWVAKVIGAGTATGLLLASLGLWAVSRRPLEGGIAFLAVTIGALCGGLIYDGHYIQLHTVNSVRAEFPEINRVWLCTNDDVTLEVEGLWFSTVDEPNAVFAIEWEGLDGASKAEIRRRLRRALMERRAVELPVCASYRLR